MQANIEARQSEAAFAPNYAVPPGAMIEEWLEEQCMTQAEFANRIGMSAKALNQMIRGHAPITHETALRLESVTHIPARTWNAMQSLFAEDKARLARREILEGQLDFLDEIPIAALRKMGVITASARDKVATITQVLDFFGVADAPAWRQLWESPAAAFRKSPAFISHPGAVAAWLRLGEQAAWGQPCGEFSKPQLEAAVGQLRALTLVSDDVALVPALKGVCAEAGVRLVLVPEVPGARCSGATRWIGGRPLVQLSLRHRTDDHLWFTLFHEIGHVLLHPRTAVFIDSDQGSPQNQQQELEADAFSRQVLIPGEYEPELRQLRGLAEIESFAREIGISPGIVVGRLQHDGLLPYSTGNRLKRTLDLAAALPSDGLGVGAA